MKSTKFSMWFKTADKVLLRRVLEVVNSNTLEWRLIEFDGSGSPPEGLSWRQTRDLLRTRHDGIGFSWSSFKTFAHGIEDTSNCVVVAIGPKDKPDYSQIEIENFETFNVCIAARYDAFWEVFWKDHHIDRASLANLQKELKEIV